MDEKDCKIVKLEDEVEKLQTESIEKAEALVESERQLEVLRESMLQQQPTHREHTTGEMKEALIRVRGLEDSNAKLKTERSELYEVQVQLKEEVSQLRQDKSKLTRDAIQ